MYYSVLLVSGYSWEENIVCLQQWEAAAGQLDTGQSRSRVSSSWTLALTLLKCGRGWEHLLYHHLRHQSVCITKQVILIYVSTVAVCTSQHTCHCGILIVIAAILELQMNGSILFRQHWSCSFVLVSFSTYHRQTTHKTTNGKLMAKLFSHPHLIS